MRNMHARWGMGHGRRGSSLLLVTALVATLGSIAASFLVLTSSFFSEHKQSADTVSTRAAPHWASRSEPLEDRQALYLQHLTPRAPFRAGVAAALHKLPANRASRRARHGRWRPEAPAGSNVEGSQPYDE